MKLIPDQPVPAPAVDMLDGKRFDIAKQAPKNFTQVVFYRGLHCLVCKSYLKSIDARLGELEGWPRTRRERSQRLGVEAADHRLRLAGGDRPRLGPLSLQIDHASGSEQ